MWQHISDSDYDIVLDLDQLRKHCLLPQHKPVVFEHDENVEERVILSFVARRCTKPDPDGYFTFRNMKVFTLFHFEG